MVTVKTNHWSGWDVGILGQLPNARSVYPVYQTRRPAREFRSAKQV